MEKTLLPLFVYTLGYAFILTCWSLLLTTRGAQDLRPIFGFAIIGIIYFYLNYCLKKISEVKSERGHLIISGTLIIALGCVISTSYLWFYNLSNGNSNAIANSIRAVIANGLFGLVISVIVTANISKKKDSATAIKADIEDKNE